MYDVSAVGKKKPVRVMTSNNLTRTGSTFQMSCVSTMDTVQGNIPTWRFTTLATSSGQ
jgi:hypothetical protein